LSKNQKIENYFNHRETSPFRNLFPKVFIKLGKRIPRKLFYSSLNPLQAALRQNQKSVWIAHKSQTKYFTKWFSDKL